MTVQQIKGMRTMFSRGQYVKLHTNDEWNDLYGMIVEVIHDVIVVFCVSMPCYLYYVFPENRHVLEAVDL